MSTQSYTAKLSTKFITGADKSRVSSSIEKGGTFFLIFVLPVANLKPFALFPLLSIFDFIFLPLFALWFIRRFNSNADIFERTPYTYALKIIMIGAMTATVFATNPLQSFFGIVVFLRFYLFFIMTAEVLKTKKDLRDALVYISIGVIVSSVIGVMQGAFGIDIRLTETDLNPNTSVFLVGQSFIRTFGTFSNSLNFANYLSVGLFTLALHMGKNVPRKLATFLFIALCITSLLQTLSRGPILAAAIGALILFALNVHAKKAFLLGLAAILLFSLVLPIFTWWSSLFGQGLLLRFAEVAENLDQNVRYQLWSEAARNFDSHIFGVGLKNSDYSVHWPAFTHTIPNYFPYKTGGWNPFNFHFESVYVAVYMNLGLIGFIGFVILIFQFLRVPFAIYKGSTEEDLKKYSKLLFAASITFSLNMVTNPAVLSDFRIMLFMWILFGLTVSLSRIHKKSLVSEVAFK